MASPFADWQNAALIFAVPTGNLTTDEMGNPVLETAPLVVTTKLKALTGAAAAKVMQYPGVDTTAIALIGRCIEPMILPANVLPENWADCSFSGAEGYFFLASPINPPHGREGVGALIEQNAGTRIVGWFQTSRSQD